MASPRPVLETLFSILCFWVSTLSSTIITELLFLQTETLKSEYRNFLSKKEAASKLTSAWKQEMRQGILKVSAYYMFQSRPRVESKYFFNLVKLQA